MLFFGHFSSNSRMIHIILYFYRFLNPVSDGSEPTRCIIDQMFRKKVTFFSFLRVFFKNFIVNDSIGWCRLSPTTLPSWASQVILPVVVAYHVTIVAMDMGC